VRRRNRDAALALFRRVVDLVKRHRVSPPNFSPAHRVIAAVSVVLPWST
jgi:hypothetical protein